MRRFTEALARGVVRRPVVVVVVALVLTGVLAFFSTRQETAQGAEGFAPNTPEFHALQTIEERFSGAGESALQVVFDAGDGDVLTAAGLRAYLAATDAVAGSKAAALLRGRPGGDVVGFMTPVVAGLRMQSQMTGVPFDTLVATVTDEQVKQAYTQALAQMPAAAAARIAGTLSAGADLDRPAASAGLMIVFENVSDLANPRAELPAFETDAAARLAAVRADGIEILPFSQTLLFASTDEFAGEVGRLFGYAFLIILLILAFVYWSKPRGGYGILHSLRRAATDTGLTLVVILAAILWMNGLGVLLGPEYLGWIGHFNPMLQILPVLLIGLGVDYAIHLTSRYREEIGRGQSVDAAAGGAVAVIGVALLLATVTTGVGFLTNVVNPVGAIRDFGILAAIGIGVAFLLMLTFLPAFRVLLDRRAERAGRLPREALAVHGERLLPRYMGRAAVLAEHAPVVTIVVAVLLGGLGAYGMTRLDTTFDFTDFLPADNPYVRTVELLQGEFGGGFERTDVVVAGDVATPAVHNALVAALDRAAAVPDVSTFAGRAVADSPVAVIARLVTPPAAGGDPTVYDAGFAAAAAAAGLRPDLTVSADTDVAALYRAAAAAAPDAMARVLATDSGRFDLELVDLTTTAGDAAALTLADDLAAAFQPVRQAGASAVPTSQAIVGRKVVTSLQRSQVWSLAITLLAATLILIVAFAVEVRRPFLGVVAMAPVVLVVLWVFGIMAARGISFNVVTAMIANLAIGIGVPYSIHITLRYLEDRRVHDSPDAAIRETTTHTGGALAGSAFTTAAGFGVLVTSTLEPFRQFGEVTFWAILMALVAAILVMPSLLVLWDRWHRRRGETLVDEAAYHRAFDEPALTPEG